MEQQDFDYLSEDCWLMALVLSDLTSMPIWVLVDKDNVPHHALVYSTAMQYYGDWRGCPRDASAIYQGFSVLGDDALVKGFRPASDDEVRLWEGRYSEEEYETAEQDAIQKFGEDVLAAVRGENE